MNAPQTAPLDATSTSTSSNTIIGSLPPNSSTTGNRRRAALSATRFPVATLPVKTIFSTADSTNAAPVEPSPTTTSNASSGTPDSCNRRRNSTAIAGVNSDGFNTTVLPATSAASVSEAGVENG